MKSKTLPTVLAADRRAAKFAVPEHDTEAARAMSFKRAIELCEWAMSEFIRAGRDDAARAALRAIDLAEGSSSGRDARALLREIDAAVGHLRRTA